MPSLTCVIVDVHVAWNLSGAVAGKPASPWGVSTWCWFGLPHNMAATF